MALIWTDYVGPNHEALRELIKQEYPAIWAKIELEAYYDSEYIITEDLSLRQHMPSAIPPTVTIDKRCELIAAAIMVKRKREAVGR